MAIQYKRLLVTVTFILVVRTTSYIHVQGKPYKSWYIGRVPPSSFEYDQLNGFYYPKRAKYVCDRDLQCGGFTFKGTLNDSTNEVETYFFHYVNIKYLTTEIQYPHWTTYIDGTKGYVVIKGIYITESGSQGVIQHTG